MKPRHVLIVAALLVLAGIGTSVVPSCHFDGRIPFVEPVKHPGAWVVLVEESSERSNEGAIFSRNTNYHADLRARGLNWTIYDGDSGDASLYRGKAETVGLPALVIVDSQKNVLLVRKWPETQDELDKAVKGATGL